MSATRNNAIKPADRRQAGHQLESLAASWLDQQGLQLVQQNFYCRVGEIDLIMMDEDTVVFVEVRFRSRTSFVDPISSINRKKQQRIIKTALYYLQRNKISNSARCRIDVLGISSASAGNYQFEWIKNAIQT
tara:strand:+ start:968 stop:1363 length:396 start_codon:yes stop_codon:yes gene_type:complete